MCLWMLPKFSPIWSILHNVDSSGWIKQMEFYYFIYYLSLHSLLPLLSQIILTANISSRPHLVPLNGNTYLYVKALPLLISGYHNPLPLMPIPFIRASSDFYTGFHKSLLVIYPSSLYHPIYEAKL